MSFDHVLLGARFPLLHLHVRDIEDVVAGAVHIVRTVLVTQRSRKVIHHPIRASAQRQVI